MVDIIAIFDKWPLLKQAHQVINRLQVVGLGGLNQAVKYGTSIRATMGVGKQARLCGQSRTVDGPFGAVVVDVDAPVS